MKVCRVCGRPLGLAAYLVVHGNMVERVCWVCKVWAETGYIMPERRN